MTKESILHNIELLLQDCNAMVENPNAWDTRDEDNWANMIISLEEIREFVKAKP